MNAFVLPFAAIELTIGDNMTREQATINCSSSVKRQVSRSRKKHIKSERIAEISAVKKALVMQGFHPHVSPVVARWFRARGFSTDCSTRQKGWFHVWADN